jgi:hypothetical protein
MEIKAITDKVLLKDRREVVKLHLYFKFLQHGIKPYESDLDIIVELYMFGGYSNSSEQNQFLDICKAKKLRKTDQSIRNTISKYINMGVFEKPKNRMLRISDKFIPSLKCDKIVLQHIISHAE